MGFLDFIFDPGKKDRERANDMYQQSINSTSSNEEYWKNIANKLMLGGNLEGRNVTGALPQSEEWNAKYFNLLNSAPDTTYNAQRGQLERGILDANKALRSNLNSRGLSNSVMGVSKFGNLAGTRALGLADLEGQRRDRLLQNTQAGAGLANNLLDRSLNATKAGSFNTQTPSLQQGYGNYLSGQANAAGSGIGQDLLAEGARNILGNVFKPTTTPMPPQSQPGGIGQSLLSWGSKYLLGF